MQQIYALIIDVFDFLVMLPAKKQKIFFANLIIFLFPVLWLLLVQSNWKEYVALKRQQHTLIYQVKHSKPAVKIKKITMLGEAFFCEQEAMKKQKIGEIRTKTKIISYYQTDKNCLFKEVS